MLTAPPSPKFHQLMAAMCKSREISYGFANLWKCSTVHRVITVHGTVHGYCSRTDGQQLKGIK
ncbi:hypothetical protein SLEP1_g20055 [Rubroshorea leprosula]|uniref:Uncharacterized protein n=1 Tax=Rubroshorea leprosula TaxID=152421 RepID=A0AAV5J4R5_9ROSI|nr:hypothetical protein SLEP1_g20055 [Rubroshorea leprosula]